MKKIIALLLLAAASTVSVAEVRQPEAQSESSIVLTPELVELITKARETLIEMMQEVAEPFIQQNKPFRINFVQVSRLTSGLEEVYMGHVVNGQVVDLHEISGLLECDLCYDAIASGALKVAPEVLKFLKIAVPHNIEVYQVENAVENSAGSIVLFASAQPDEENAGAEEEQA